jgi:mannose-6-phosphate isomerase-like protein (cupin superfamily)
MSAGLLKGIRQSCGKADPMSRYEIAQLDEIEPTACPCGMSRRAFVHPDNPVASIHMVDISKDSRVHYHKKLTEIYLILEGEGHMELDGEQIPVRPMTTILIKPGCRHRAVGRMKIVNVPIPAFDPADEWFDD